MPIHAPLLAIGANCKLARLDRDPVTREITSQASPATVTAPPAMSPTFAIVV
jgi:hypothetical protein